MQREYATPIDASTQLGREHSPITSGTSDAELCPVKATPDYVVIIIFLLFLYKRLTGLPGASRAMPSEP
eukprot:1195866-Prorocentrum_minimum.AAC.12